MQLRLHHIEMCVQDPKKVLHTLCWQFGLELVGERDTPTCKQLVLKLGKTVFIVTTKKSINESDFDPGDGTCTSNNNIKESHVIKDSNAVQGMDSTKHCCRRPAREPWTVFCCSESNNTVSGTQHVDSVFNVALEVKNLRSCLHRLKQLSVSVIQDVTEVWDEFGTVSYAIVKSCCGNVVHTLLEKGTYDGWFLPFYQRVETPSKPTALEEEYQLSLNSYFDHVTFVCRTGGTDPIIRWYEKAFGMKRFITNREDSQEDGVMIGDDVGLRLKVMEFWKCSEVGLASVEDSEDDKWEMIKIVIAESLPSFQNTQVEHFIDGHNGPGLQHIGLHTPDIMTTVSGLSKRGVQFRQPPPTYYTSIGQLGAIEAVGEDPEHLSKFGILLDREADPFDEENSDLLSADSNRYLMQIFTFPLFSRDTFFLEVIQRKGARGFGVGNVTALARSVNAYQKQLQREKAKQNSCD